MTSLYPTQHGVRGNFQHLGRALETGERIRSFPQILEKNGWATAAFVGATPLKRASGIAARTERDAAGAYVGRPKVHAAPGLHSPVASQRAHSAPSSATARAS